MEVWEEFVKVGGVVGDDPGGGSVVGAEGEEGGCEFGLGGWERGVVGEHLADTGEEAGEEAGLGRGMGEAEGEIRLLQGWWRCRPLGAVDESSVEDSSVHMGEGYGVVLAPDFSEVAAVGWLVAIGE